LVITQFHSKMHGPYNIKSVVYIVTYYMLQQVLGMTFNCQTCLTPGKHQSCISSLSYYGQMASIYMCWSFLLFVFLLIKIKIKMGPTEPFLLLEKEPASDVFLECCVFQYLDKGPKFNWNVIVVFENHAVARYCEDKGWSKGLTSRASAQGTKMLLE
jgi:hypothetical protein